jgi:hypothetical protein
VPNSSSGSYGEVISERSPSDLGRLEPAARLGPLLTAGSMSRRNTSLKFIRWGFKSQCLSRTLIQSERDPI